MLLYVYIAVVTPHRYGCITATSVTGWVLRVFVNFYSAEEPRIARLKGYREHNVLSRVSQLACAQAKI